METELVRHLAVGKVRPDRPDGRAQARADAVAERGLEQRLVVPRLPGVDEAGHAPAVADPVGVLGARDEHAPAAEDRRALLYAQAFEGIAAHGLVAAGAKKKAARDADPALGVDEAALGPHQEV